MPDVTLVIDGKTVTVPAGTNIVDAARKADTAVPVFCYHPKMSAVGMCRMCLVEVWTPMTDRATNQPVLDENGKPKMALMMNKLQTGCTTPVSPGMEVRTQTDQVKGAQKGILEFLLTSHPLDCPVCDKGGECPLQNLTMGWGPGKSRFDYEDKVHFQKPIPLSDVIMLDRERCILCSRCVRFEDTIAGDPVLGFDNRGRSWEIISKSDPGFDSKFSGNTTDICPVGALTSADFRFKARVWELRSVPSIDPHTCEGANITVDMRYNEVKRIMPRENDFVNEIWIGDKTRFAHHFASSKERLTTPMIRRGRNLEPCSWDEAIRTVGEKLGAIKSAAGGTALGGLAGDHCANEDLFAFGRLFREVLGSNNLDHRVGSPADLPLDTLGQRLGVGKGTNLMTLGKETTVLVLGADPEEEAPIYLLRLRTMQQRGANLIVANGRTTKLDDAANQRLRYRYGDEADLVNALCSVILEEKLANDTLGARTRGLSDLQRGLSGFSAPEVATRLGIDEQAIRSAARAFAQAKNAIVVYGHEAQQVGPALQQALANLVLLTGAYGRANSGLLPILPHNNSRGALDMGIRPDMEPGYKPVSKTGLSAREMWGAAAEGRLRGMYIMGLDPAAKYPGSREALEKLEFLVVQDLFLTETAQLADVVLPAASFIEREGTFTNAERRVQRFRAARPATGESRADWAIVQDVARALSPRTVEVASVLANGATSVAAGRKKDARGRTQTQTAVAEPAVATTPADSWTYVTTADVAADMTQAVAGYNVATYARLSATGHAGSWGRQINEAVYYDGTSYENTEGVGVQLSAQADDGKSSFAVGLDLTQPNLIDPEYPLMLVGVVAHYNGGTQMRESLLLKRVVQPMVFVGADNAARFDIKTGDMVRVTSAAGWVEMAAKVDPTLQDGAVVAFDNLADASLAPVQTGARTPVRIAKVEA